TGTITFTLYSPSSVVDYTDTVTVTGNGSYDTSVGTNPGGYLTTARSEERRVGRECGDRQNNGASDNGQNEAEVVSPASPTINTVAGVTVVIGIRTFLFAAVLTCGLYSSTGTITFTLYSPSSVVVYTDTVTVTGNGSYDTSVATNPGGYLPTA